MGYSHFYNRDVAGLSWTVTVLGVLLPKVMRGRIWYWKSGDGGITCPSWVMVQSISSRYQQKGIGVGTEVQGHRDGSVSNDLTGFEVHLRCNCRYRIAVEGRCMGTVSLRLSLDS
jgi:hypothetical protein